MGDFHALIPFSGEGDLGHLNNRLGVVFLVQTANHVSEAVATQRELKLWGLDSTLITPAPPSDLSRSFRSSHRRYKCVVQAASTLGVGCADEHSVRDLLSSTDALVVWNDWGPSQGLVRAMQERSIPTIGWVEGVQDFLDVDTGRNRFPYQSVDHVFCLGEYDHQVLSPLVGRVHIVGSQRIWDTWNSGSKTDVSVPVLANVNFSYGVLTKSRTMWTRSVIEATRRAGLDPVLSRHPADRGFYGFRYESSEPLDSLLPRCGVFISRFSTAIYTALALRVPTVYFNPHDEQVQTFANPLGAFEIATSQSDLESFIDSATVCSRKSVWPFLSRHLTLEGDPPSVRAAKRIVEIVDRNYL